LRTEIVLEEELAIIEIPHSKYYIVQIIIGQISAFNRRSTWRFLN